MESIVNSLADKFNEKINLDDNLIISGGLVLNAFALMELVKGNFVLFLIGTVLAFFTDRLVTETLYQRVAEWIKLFTVLAFFSTSFGAFSAFFVLVKPGISNELIFRKVMSCLCPFSLL